MSFKKCCITEEHMSALEHEVSSTLKRFIPPNSKVAYIDYPLHGNVGDIYIFLGAKSFLLNNNNKVVHSATVFSYNTHTARKKITNDTIILLHGGGNFGDIYRSHQILRLQLLNDFPNNKIVLLPQSIHYENDTLKASDFEKLNHHRFFHALVRDNESYDLLISNGINSTLCPDSAHLLYPHILQPYEKRPLKNLYLLRTDKERIPTQKHLTHPNSDWEDILSTWDKKVVIRSLRWASKLCRFMGTGDFCWNITYYYYANAIKKKIDRYFQKYQTISTSRLHGLIIALLNGCEVYVSDNNYGKIKRYLNYIEGSLVHDK